MENKASSDLVTSQAKSSSLKRGLKESGEVYQTAVDEVEQPSYHVSGQASVASTSLVGSIGQTIGISVAKSRTTKDENGQQCEQNIKIDQKIVAKLKSRIKVLDKDIIKYFKLGLKNGHLATKRDLISKELGFKPVFGNPFRIRSRKQLTISENKAQAALTTRDALKLYLAGHGFEPPKIPSYQKIKVYQHILMGYRKA